MFYIEELKKIVMQKNIKSQQIIDLYNQGKSINEIVQLMNYKSNSFVRSTIRQYKYQQMKNNNIPIQLKQSPESIKKSQNVMNDYNNGMKIADLMKKYNYKTDRSIYNIINNYKLQNKEVQSHYNNNLNINTNINIMTHEEINKLNIIIPQSNNVYDFLIIDEPWKAYFIGIMLTDGCINKNNNISICIVDKEIIELFANKFNIKIKTCILKDLNVYNTKFPNYQIQSQQQTYCISILYKTKNPKLIEQLNRFGIRYDQSTNIDYPHLLPEEYQFLPYIMQGIIDGDGCILHTGTMFHISSMNKNLLIWCKLIFEQWFGMTNLHLYDVTGKKYSQSFYRLDTSIKENMEILKNLIYKNNIGLERKYKILQDKV